VSELGLGAPPREGHPNSQAHAVEKAVIDIVMTRSRVAVLILVLSLFLSSCSAPAVGTPLPAATRLSSSSTTAPVATAALAGSPKAATRAPVPTQTPAAVQGSQRPAQISLVPQAPVVEGAAPVAVDIVLDDLVDLYGAEVHLTFDPAIIQVQDVDAGMPGTQIKPGSAFGQGTSFVALNRADNAAGKIDFAVTLLNPAEPLQGKVVLATFTVQAAKAGSTDLKFVQVLLADRQANALPLVSKGLTLSAKP
jgi:general secretion pathway protein D